MSVTLTTAAANRIINHLQTRGHGEGLRVSVKKSGCSGYAYELGYAEEINASDSVFESHGVKVIINSEHLSFLDGMELDYVEDGLSSAFHFKNPNVTEQCGCGESFTVN
ncbi:MAG: iron-sulfur cluster assembly accessory protein [Gammaproteobacteria bacterium]|nr:iron-sulfur cluster assembly accessory protein [Gammaproteobacteria bacterium]MCY4219114.1 iron-sulfur cluster assembly accessory protein [Gammaproteobacteria bacterium]MCY4274115.1 iron-sulfur cluster assembly accessory protein [Gammaproteobacteria bacterium]